MSLFSALKSNARRALRGNWGKAILTLLIWFGASALLSVMQQIAVNMFAEPVDINPALAMRYGVNEYFFQALQQNLPANLLISLLFAVLSVLLLAPLGLGITHWYRQLVLGEAAPLSELFRFFESGKQYVRALWYNINLSVRLFLWAALFYLIPGGVLGGSVYTLYKVGEDGPRATAALASVGVLLAGILFLLATVFYSAVVSKYLLVPYLLCEDDALRVSAAIRASARDTKGHRFSLVWFQLSFFGWMLLVALGLGFPLLYVWPYLQTAVAMYARYIMEKARHAPQVETREFVVEHPAQQTGTPPPPDGPPAL